MKQGAQIHFSLLLFLTFGTVILHGASPATSEVAEWGRRALPVVDPGTRFTSIAASEFHNVALTQHGKVVAWGDNFWQQATAPEDLAEVKAVAAGRFHSLAVKSNGTVVA